MNARRLEIPPQLDGARTAGPRTTRRGALGLGLAATAGLLTDRGSSPALANAAETAELINVKSYGAKGDGITDDTEAFQLAGEEAMVRNCRLVIPGSARAYRVNNVQWSFPNETRPMYMEGAGKFKTTIEKIGGDDLPIFKFTGTAGALANNSVIRGMSLRGQSQGSPGMVLENCAWVEIEDVDIRGCLVGIAGLGLLTSVLRRVILEGNTEGLSLTKGAVGSNLITVEHSVISGNPYRGINADHCPSLRLEHIDIENNGESGKPNTGGVYIGENVTEEYGYGTISIFGCWFEVNKGRALTCSSGELRVRESVFLATDLSAHATSGRDIFVTGRTSRCSVIDSEILSVVGPLPSIWVDHPCLGRVQNSTMNRVQLPVGMQVQEH